MAWTYLAESAELPKDSPNGLDQSPTASGIDSPSANCSSGNFMGISHARQYGMTFGPLKVKCSHEFPTLYMGDSPARISPLQTSLEKAWTASEAVFFSTSPDYAAIYDQSSCSWKTSQLSLFGGLTEFVWNSLRWGMIVAGRLYQPPKLEPHTSGKDGLCWPTATATATAYGSNQTDSPNAQVRPSLQTIAKNWPTPRAFDANVRGKFQKSGREESCLGAAAMTWPTPRSSDGKKGGPNSVNSDGSPLLPAAAARWATATARDYKGRDTPSRHGKHSPSIDIQVAETGHPGLLSPRFVEELMGYKRGSTKLNHLGTPWSRCRSAKPSDDSADCGDE